MDVKMELGNREAIRYPVVVYRKIRPIRRNSRSSEIAGLNDGRRYHSIMRAGMQNIRAENNDPDITYVQISVSLLTGRVMRRPSDPFSRERAKRPEASEAYNSGIRK